jgi:hypothetical protein
LHFLPPEIFRYLANYFLEKEDHDKNVFKFSHDWRNFMNTKKDSFEKWKKKSQLIILSSPLAEEFYESAEVRSQVVQYVENPRQQIVFALQFATADGSNSINLEIVNNVKRVSLYKMDTVSATSRQLNWILLI